MDDDPADACDSATPGAAVMAGSVSPRSVQAGGGEGAEAVVLEAEHPVVMLDDDVVQVGVGSQALRLSGDRGQIETALTRLRRGAPVEGAQTLVAALLDRGLARRAGDAVRRQERIRRSAVLVEGLGPCGARITEHLCSLGVGAVLLRDGRTVGEAEIGGVYRTVHHGQDRSAAVQQAMGRRPEPTALIGCPPEGQAAGVDLHVLCTGPGAWEALRSAAEESRTVLPVELCASGVRIGPFISAGRLTCPECLRQHGLDGDPLWEALQSELRRIAAAHAYDGGASARPADPQLEPSSVLGRGAGAGLLVEQAAALAAHQIAVLLQGGRQSSAETAAISLDVHTGQLRQHPVSVHPECACVTMVS